MSKMTELLLASTPGLPYRVTCSIACPPPAYSRTVVGTFATEGEARVAFEASGPYGMRGVSLCVRKPEGGWMTLARRNRRK
jgi:hypothetical protein